MTSVDTLTGQPPGWLEEAIRAVVRDEIAKSAGSWPTPIEVPAAPAKRGRGRPVAGDCDGTRYPRSDPGSGPCICGD